MSALSSFTWKSDTPCCTPFFQYAVPLLHYLVLTQPERPLGCIAPFLTACKCLPSKMLHDLPPVVQSLVWQQLLCSDLLAVALTNHSLNTALAHLEEGSNCNMCIWQL